MNISISYGRQLLSEIIAWSLVSVSQLVFSLRLSRQISIFWEHVHFFMYACLFTSAPDISESITVVTFLEVLLKAPIWTQLILYIREWIMNIPTRRKMLISICWFAFLDKRAQPWIGNQVLLLPLLS